MFIFCSIIAGSVLLLVIHPVLPSTWVMLNTEREQKRKKIKELMRQQRYVKNESAFVFDFTGINVLHLTISLLAS